MFAPSARIATFAAAVAAVLIATADACSTAPFGYCGNNAGTSCCPDNQYCQPWNDNYYQCRDPPAQCSQQFTNTDFYGDDIKAVYGVQPEVCCDICTNTPGCTSYTFINNNPGSPVCYLKSGAATDRRPLTGAVSGIVNSAAPPSPPTPVCNTPPFGYCGNNAGASCCSGNQYCQPWNDNYYQCLEPPAQCGRQLTDTDFYGNDIKTVYVNHPTLCCDECANTPGCKAYTYINNNPGQPVCYLKSAAGTPSRLVGAVAGQLN